MRFGRAGHEPSPELGVDESFLNTNFRWPATRKAAGHFTNAYHGADSQILLRHR
jgi:hypothetical protein